MLAFDEKMPTAFLPDLSLRESPHTWIVVTHVCKHWRETALAFPALWSVIDSDSALTALAFLDRSAASRLSVFLRDAAYGSRYSPSLERARFMQSVAQHSPRFVELHIQPQFRYGAKILSALQYPVPELRALSIMLNLGKDEPQELPVLFSGRMPKLERLTLANFTSWSGNSFGSNLTHLCLLDQHPRARMDMLEFLDFLESCPHLKELVLIEAGPTTRVGEEPDSARLVVLDDLELLHVGGWPTPQCISRFLSHLVIPSTTKVHLWAECLFSRGEIFSSLLPSNLTYLRAFQNLKAVHCTFRPSRRDFPQLVSVQDGVLVFFSYFGGSTPPAMMRSVFDTLDVRAIEELTIGVDCTPELPAADWCAILDSMPRLHRLNVLRRPSRPLLSALRCADTAGKLPCPALSTLSISDDHMLSSIALYLLAEDRAAAGAPLQKLEVITKMSAYSPRLEAELEELKKIPNVVYEKDQPFDVTSLPVGWPDETYRWIAKQSERRARRR